jgi:hypothetical protein
MPKGIYIRTDQMKLNRSGELNPNWQGDNVTYSGVHAWARKNLPLPRICKCGSIKFVDASNPTKTYVRDLKYWKWECRKCHMKNDGRSEKFASIGRSRSIL